MKAKLQEIRKCTVSGAVCGMAAWAVYAVIECLCSSILPIFIQKYFVFTPWHWRYCAILFGIYPVIGLVIGGSVGIFLCIVVRQITSLRKIQTSKLTLVAASLSVVLVFTINLIYRIDLNFTVFCILIIFLLLAFCLVLSARSDIWFERLYFLINPWTISFILIGVPFMNLELLENYSLIVKAITTLGYTSVVVSVSFIVNRVVTKIQIDKSPVTILVYSKKSLVILAVILFGILGISFFWIQSSPPMSSSLKSSTLNANKPNIIMIVLDTVWADHLSVYGYERDTTPNLKKFSENAIKYTNAIASGDITLSTHASIFTGTYARKHGAHFDTQGLGRPLAEKFETIAELLSENGYETMVVVANHVFFGKGYGLEQGFVYFDSRGTKQYIILHSLGSIRKFYLMQGIHRVLIRIASPHPSNFEKHYRKAEEINRESYSLLDKMRKENKHFFLFVNYMDAHWPYIPPSPFDTFYPGKDEAFRSFHHFKMLSEVVAKRERRITEKERSHLVSQYDGGIANIDFNLGKLFERLKKLGLYENSLIIITSDHGEAFGERDLIEHGVSVYQNQIHVPLIIKYPNINEGEIVDELVSSIDLMPTILDVLDFKIPEQVQGQSLLNYETAKSKIVISESYPNISFLGQRFDRVERAIFSDRYKFISSTAGKRELYDLQKDPEEKENLYQTDDGISNELETKLSRWLRNVKEEYGLPAKKDNNTLKHLKALGYTQ